MAETSTANRTIVTSILSSVLPPILVQASSLALDQYDICSNINTEIMYLQITLNEVNEILEEAEERQIDNTTVRGLLRHLVDIAYEARDELDDFITSASTISTRSTSRSVLFNNCLPISFFLSWFDDRWSSIVQVVLPFTVRYRVAWNIRSIRSRLADVMKQRDIVDISQYVSERKTNSESVPKIVRPESSSFTDNQSDLLVGREDVKEDIMEKLLDKNNNHVQLVAIWGMGGVGKTTLAQNIYDDDRVKCYHKRWFPVGGKLMCKEIISKILDQSDTHSIDVMQRQVVEKLKRFTAESLDDENLKNRRFLIVLDDVWEVDSREWDLLWNPMTHVDNGGMIIITTRIGNVISASNTQVQHNLLPLSYDDCWTIFESHAFLGGKSDNKPDLKCIGQEIVKKLQGLPLAAKVVGRSLFNEPYEKIWEDFLHAREWKLRKKDDDVMPALRWSYKRLPPHLKHCFAYCALFPKDHEFDEKVLVQMWMAHDLIQINADGRPEDVGAQYFKELVYASLIQYVDDRYVMHDMIRDLSLHVSNEEFSSAVASLSTDQMEKVRHITIPIDNEYSKNLSLCKSKRILTVYTPYEGDSSTPPLDKDILLEVFKHSKSLRVLVLSNKHISEIPECISELKHLRYLDVKQTSVKSLPNSLCQLHNLQMLAAPLDAILPRDIVNIRSLRYIRANVPTCRGIEKLSSLQELSSIHVCEGDNIRELGVMRQLRGELKVNGLENVSSSQEAAQALMQDKPYLEELVLEFSRDLEKSSIVTDVLDALGCPPNLKWLKIVGYTGVKFPSWMEDGKLVAKLQTLELFKCCQFEFLLPLGEMRSLENLTIEDCTKIKHLNFSSLPSLRMLCVCNCEELISISGLVAVRDLSIGYCEKLKSVSTDFQGLDSIEYLVIFDCPLLEPIREERSTSPSSSSTFLLSSSPWSRLFGLLLDNEQIFRNIFEQDLLSYIGAIAIKTNSMLVECLGEIMKNKCRKLKSFDYLDIIECPQLQSIPTSCLPSTLQKLELVDCPRLQSLPAVGFPPLSLTHLFIQGCPLLYERCKDKSGLDWHKIEYIKHRDIRP